MSRLLIIIAVVPILITFILRWWFGLRHIASLKTQQCTCNLEKWQDTLGDGYLPASSSGDLIIYADLLRKSALADWKIRDSKTAISREASRRFSMAVPPLTAMIVILGAVVGRVPPVYAIAIFLLSIAFTASVSYLSLAPELKAILVTSRRVRDRRIFPRKDDEDAVIQTAISLAWKEAAPPIFNLIQR